MKVYRTPSEALGLEYRRSFRDVLQGAHPLYNAVPEEALVVKRAWTRIAGFLLLIV
jgi:hypothetical protein